MQPLRSTLISIALLSWGLSGCTQDPAVSTGTTNAKRQRQPAMHTSFPGTHTMGNQSATTGSTGPSSSPARTSADTDPVTTSGVDTSSNEDVPELIGDCANPTEAQTIEVVPFEVLLETTWKLGAPDQIHTRTVARNKDEYLKLVELTNHQLPAWEELPYPNVAFLPHEQYPYFGGCGFSFADVQVVRKAGKVHVDLSYFVNDTGNPMLGPTCGPGAVVCPAAFMPSMFIAYADPEPTPLSVCERISRSCPR